MAKISQQDPKTSEILSTLIAGISEAVSKISESTNMKTAVATGVQLDEVLVSDSDRFRIYQAPEGKKNWTDDEVVVYKNGTEITPDTDHFVIDRVGGGISFDIDHSITSLDTITADFTYVKSVPYADTEFTSNKIQEITAASTDVQYPSAKAVYAFINKIINQEVPTVNPFPVGAIYISVVGTDPSELFGGTWERIQDTFLLAAGSVYEAGTEGGEASHTLTGSEIPSHTHRLLYYKSNGTQGFGYNFQNKGEWTNTSESSSGIGNYGGSQSHNNMPPYLAVYVWKRTT